MIVFLVKVRVRTVFNWFDPIRVEPLELCYLKTVLDQLQMENHLVDDLFGLGPPEGTRPDVIVLNGYNVAEEEMVRQALAFKSRFPGVVTIVGGVHVQVNPESFRREGIDHVYDSSSLEGFRSLMKRILAKEADWQSRENKVQTRLENLWADRSFFRQMAGRTHYLEKRKVALIKGSVGCPYTCSYCFCREVNQGRYIRADYDRMAEEMEKIDAEYFWIVDDVLLVDRSDALGFIKAVKGRNVKGKIIAYLRADFILRERDLLEELRKIGLAEVIVGFEAASNKELEGYGKTTDALDYPTVIGLLKQNGIDLSALFMVQPDYGIKDFWNLWNFIGKNRIQVFTLSILTPMKGTREYEEMKSRLVTHNPRKFDFLHAVVPTKLVKPVFYALFYGIQLRMLGTGRLWRAVLRKGDSE